MNDSKYPESLQGLSVGDIIQEDEVQRHGFLKKKSGGVVRTGLPLLQDYQQRYFVIHKGWVYYYKDKSSSEPKGQFSLENFSTTVLKAEEESASSQFVFKIFPLNNRRKNQTPSRTWYFAADNRKDMEGWIDSFRTEIDKYNRPRAKLEKSRSLPGKSIGKIRSATNQQLSTGSSPDEQRRPHSITSPIGHKETEENKTAEEEYEEVGIVTGASIESIQNRPLPSTPEDSKPSPAPIESSTKAETRKAPARPPKTPTSPTDAAYVRMDSSEALHVAKPPSPLNYVDVVAEDEEEEERKYEDVDDVGATSRESGYDRPPPPLPKNNDSPEYITPIPLTPPRNTSKNRSKPLTPTSGSRDEEVVTSSGRYAHHGPPPQIPAPTRSTPPSKKPPILKPKPKSLTAEAKPKILSKQPQSGVKIIENCFRMPQDGFETKLPVAAEVDSKKSVVKKEPAKNDAVGGDRGFKIPEIRSATLPRQTLDGQLQAKTGNMTGGEFIKKELRSMAGDATLPRSPVGGTRVTGPATIRPAQSTTTTRHNPEVSSAFKDRLKMFENK